MLDAAKLLHNQVYEKQQQKSVVYTVDLLLCIYKLLHVNRAFFKLCTYVVTHTAHRCRADSCAKPVL